MNEGLKLKYFVLNPASKDREYAVASSQAMLSFANSIESSNRLLAIDLREWVINAYGDLEEL